EKIQATPGEIVTSPSGQAEAWASHTADSAGWFRGDYLHNGYGLFDVASKQDRTVLLEAMGNYLVYVNGVPREGNMYGYKDTWDPWEPAFDYSMIPVQLRKGDNQLLFFCVRGMLKVKIEDVKPGVLFNAKDVTLPNFLVGEKVNYYAAVTVINATDRPLQSAYLEAYNDSGYSSETEVPIIQPMSIRKVGFKLVGPAPSSAGTMSVNLRILDGITADAQELARTEVSVKIVPPTSTHNVTFISDIDHSVQYYSIVPPRNLDSTNNSKLKALFLSLHGADVITTNMANSYSPKTWGYIVCPTNGGPYGYDWEDWGRLDALQVLGIAESTLNIDPDRIYLTGHSMGGHGTWIIGAQYPDQFAAIGPSSGWVSWWTYVFHHDSVATAMDKMLRRSTTPSNTYLLDQNYKQLGLYILHGSKDDNVPVTESVDMADTLSKFDKDFTFHEEMGAGHWWGLNDQASTDCVDWPPMFDFFARHARPGEERVEDIDFTTASPGVSAKDYWLTIYAQEKQLEMSRVIVKFVPFPKGQASNLFVGTTSNVKIMSFDLSMTDRSKPLDVSLDSTRVDGISVPSNADRLWLENESGEWKVTSEPSPNEKGPSRYGTLKDAFRHDVIFVYGTHGTEEENKWAFDKARADAESFWYHRGGSVDIVSDREFKADVDPDRNVILYGNESTNSAWDEVLSSSPVNVSDGKLTFGHKVMDGRDYACFMVRPRKGSASASVGVVAGTGIVGMRLTFIVPYLQPWFSLPDLTILNSSIFSREKMSAAFTGQKNGGGIGFGGERGIKVAGFFGLDWSVASGEFVVEK
ncbi:MAG TPA: prolyl oligopeptidase family serine peptidase, partial [Candidatus Acidoferrales bacterium]|nr:prolyl oligopeptidase family serine peptidase [Candidatus Acidoferrales bacterium]